MCESTGHKSNELDSMAIVAEERRSGSPSCSSLSTTWRGTGNDDKVQKEVGYKDKFFSHSHFLLHSYVQ